MVRRRTRALSAALLAFGVTGCAASQTDFYPHDRQYADAACRAVANDRANDAGVTNEGVDVQRQVFLRTYSNCIDGHRLTGTETTNGTGASAVGGAA
ncbi:MAG TPA: hypothetical protein VMF67_12320 [Rhizomicrobium sp.]|nr:hypothetical protein [Rhizomicrobium sp.]